MKLSESILPKFDHEMANTRKVLERIPEGKLERRAHERSNTIGSVGMHLAEIPGWTFVTPEQDSLDFGVGHVGRVSRLSHLERCGSGIAVCCEIVF